MTGLRGKNGQIAAPPFTNSPYTWDATLEFTNTTGTAVVSFNGYQTATAPIFSFTNDGHSASTVSEFFVTTATPYGGIIIEVGGVKKVIPVMNIV